MILIDLIHNIALLVTLTVIHEIITRRIPKETVGAHILKGVLFALAGIVGMMTPIHFASGIIYDGRSIIIAAAGLFGGPITGIITAGLTGIFRVWIGGTGSVVGVLVILNSLLMGTAVYFLRRRFGDAWVRPLPLLALGVLVHGGMLGLQLLLPGGLGIRVIMNIGPFVIVAYTAAFFLICQVFLEGERREISQRELALSEERYRSLYENNHAIMLIIDPSNMTIVDANPAAVQFYGWSREEFGKMNIKDINTLPEKKLKERMNRAQSENRYYFLFQHRRADNSVRDVEVFSGPVIFRKKKLLYSIIHDVTERRRAEQALTNSLREKDELLKEVHHRVKNNLAVINSLIQLQLSETTTKERAISILEKTSDRIGAMSQIHNFIYRDNNFSKIEFSKYIIEMADHLMLQYAYGKDIHVSFDFHDFIVSLERAVPLGLIVNEAISNALQHAFPRGIKGEITIISKKTDGENQSLLISDNGIGMEKKTDKETGLGMQLIEILSSQIDGALNIRTDNGTALEITFPRD